MNLLLKCAACLEALWTVAANSAGCRDIVSGQLFRPRRNRPVCTETTVAKPLIVARGFCRMTSILSAMRGGAAFSRSKGSDANDRHLPELFNADEQGPRGRRNGGRRQPQRQILFFVLSRRRIPAPGIHCKADAGFLRRANDEEGYAALHGLAVHTADSETGALAGLASLTSNPKQTAGRRRPWPPRRPD